MNPLSSVLVVIGASVALLAGIGLLRFSSPYARFHAAGKASPVAFLLVAGAAAMETGWPGAARLTVAGAALVLTLPVSVHLLFRAVYRTTDTNTLSVNQLGSASAQEPPSPDPTGQSTPAEQHPKGSE